MVELQSNLATLTRNGIRAFAISPDSPEILRKFAQKYEITYPLLSDEGSRVIQAFGILNTNIPEDHECFLPETLTFVLPLHFLPHDWELIT